MACHGSASANVDSIPSGPLTMALLFSLTFLPNWAWLIILGFFALAILSP